MFGRIKKALIIRLGDENKKSFKRSLPQILSSIPPVQSDLQVVSMSGKKYFEDQLLSLLSFYYNVGVPKSWTIYNDGSYTDAEINLFDQIVGVEVKDVFVDEEFKEITEEFKTLKKVFIFKNTCINEPVAFVDSDVVFYKPFLNNIQPYLHKNCYLVDEGQGYFDEDTPEHVSKEDPLNLGFLLLSRSPDWSIVFNYVKNKIKSKQLSYWSDQTAFHILAKKDEFVPLSKEKFVTGGRDAFTFKNSVDYSSIALRHFVGPVRHKMWQIKWDKVLGIKQ